MGRRTASERARPPHRAWTHAAACLFSAARQLDSTRIRRIGLLCTPRAPARPTRARAGPDGRADSTALRSTTRALLPCAAGLMHSTRAHGAGIAAIAAIRQSPRDGIPNLINCCQRIGLDAQRRYRDSGSCTDETVRGRAVTQPPTPPLSSILCLRLHCAAIRWASAACALSRRPWWSPT